MVRQKVVDYIRGLLQKGYDISTIKNTMLKYGYSSRDIDEAVNAVYNPTVRHEIHLSKPTILVIIFIVLSAIGTGAFFYFSQDKSPHQLLDLKLEPVRTEVKAGEEVLFIKEMSNLGSSKRYDVILNVEIIDAVTFKRVSYNAETIAIETSSTSQSRLQIPKDAKPGDYLLRVTAEYNNQKAFAKLPVKITSPSNEISSQPEPQAEAPKPDCNDNNACTEDIIENGKCSHTPITPCCGNGICESDEEKCESDCRKEISISPETIDEIKELAKSEPEKALQQCNKIEVPILKDTCIRNIGEAQKNKNYCLKIIDSDTKDACYRETAKLANDNTICEEIVNAGIKDACYMTFVLDNHDYSVCSKITLKVQRESCESLRQIYAHINSDQ